ncbi:MAG TPA: hypothetical protein VGB71_00125 [Flavisolibacter sp.]|jgi:GLPGLI family protein
MKKGNFIRGLDFILSCLAVLVFNCCFGQSKAKIQKAVYHLNSSQFSVAIPDTIFKQLGINAGSFELPIGVLVYSNYYRNGFSRTDVSFEPNKGVNLKNNTSASFYSRMKDSALFVYEENRLTKKVIYQLPALIKEGKSKQIKKYNCEAYTYSPNDSSKIVVWFSRELPFYVSPGVYFKKLGGIVQIEFFFNQENSTLDLLSHEITEEQIDFKRNLQRPNGERSIHFLFNRK